MPVFVLLVMVLGGLVYYDYQKTKASILKNESQYYNLVEKMVNNAVASQISKARSGVIPIAENPAVQKAFAERDREQLALLIKHIYDELSKEGVSQLQFHLPPARSFYRAHKPEKYGDDLSSFRRTVVACNKEKKIVQGLEEGVAGFGFRVVVLVTYQSRHIGSVEVGSSFGTSFAQN